MSAFSAISVRQDRQVILVALGSLLAARQARAARAPKSGLAAAISASTTPNVQTMVAPVGRSSCSDRYTPSADTIVPIDQPIASRLPIESAYSIAATDGTIR